MMLYRFEVDYTVPGKMGSKNYVTAVAATDAAHARVEAGKIFEGLKEDYGYDKALGKLYSASDGTFYSAATCSQKVGQMLLDANFASVNERYNENAPVRVFKMKSKPDGDPFTLGERYGCITSYENQTCAAPGYNESEIHCVLSHVKDDLAEKMIVRLGDQPSGGL